MLSFSKINKTFITPSGPLSALTDINLDIQAGEIFGVIGQSGAGKSTLIRCANVLERPSSGDVHFDGQNLTALSDTHLRLVRRQIGMIFQQFNILSSRTVYENVALPLSFSSQSKQQVRDIVMPLLELTGLAHKCDAYPNELSGGQKQRVAIARALANKPKLLLCDEATSALDPETTQSILDLLKDINQKLDLTIMLITHEMEVVKRICHRLAILEKGQIIEQGGVVEFFSKPKTPTAKRFVDQPLTEHLPRSFQEQILAKPAPNTYPVWRLSFRGKTTQEPFIAHLVKKYKLNINILLANIESIHDEIVGTLLVSAQGEEKALKASTEYLIEHGIDIEVLGYVS